MRNNNTNPGQSILSDSIKWLTNVLAFGAAFFGGPEIYMRSLPFVLRFAESRYGPGFEGLVQFVWFALTLAFVFFSTRIAFAFALITLSGSVALRLFAA